MYVWCWQQAGRPAVSRKGSIKWYCIVLYLILCNFDHWTLSHPLQFWSLDTTLSLAVLSTRHHLILCNFDHLTSSYPLQFWSLYVIISSVLLIYCRGFQLAGIVTPNDGKCHLDDGRTNSMSKIQASPLSFMSFLSVVLAVSVLASFLLCV